MAPGSTLFRLDGEVALITGGGGGIGAATARLMADLGAAVAVVDRAGDAAERVVADVAAAGGRALALAADVADADAIERAVAATTEALGPLTVLVANAAIQLHVRDVALDALSEAAWDETQDVNLRGAFLTCRAGLRKMLAQGRGGAIVIVSSVAALTGASGNTAYAVSKGGLNTMGRLVANRYARDRIRCNVVCPGALETTPDHAAHPDPDGRAARLAAAIPLGRPGRAEEIAPMIAFLASPAASYATAGIFVVDGGRTAT